MKIKLKIKTSIEGYSQLFGVHHSRIKAVSREEKCTNIHSTTIKNIMEKYGYFRQEYRLVKEPEGFIFRGVITDTGINGHHQTMKRAITAALRSVSIYIDEEFNYQEYAEFSKLASYHSLRQSCKHRNYELMRGFVWCPDCGTSFAHEKHLKQCQHSKK